MKLDYQKIVFKYLTLGFVYWNLRILITEFNNWCLFYFHG